MAKLFWLQPDSSIIEFPLKAEQNLIGRTGRCDVRIKHPGISAEHAVIRVLPGSATVEDLGSTNGTRVNGKKIDLHTLRHGDQIGVGRERLMYFAELDDAAKFIQPESIEPFALPAAGGELVNTTADVPIEPPAVAPILPPPAVALPAAGGELVNTTAGVPVETPAISPILPPPAVTSAAPTHRVERKRSTTWPQLDGKPDIHSLPGPDLDPSLLAALPKGASLVNPPMTPRAKAPTVALASAAVAAKATLHPPAAVPAKTEATSTGVRSLSASVAVLSGASSGKRFPLSQPSVTLGKEGKQVIEFLRISPTRWQIKQLEGVIPAYINGDALAGVRDLAAGDVVELTGVRLRFEITLNR